MISLDEQIALITKKSTSGNTINVTRIHLESNEFTSILTSLRRLKRIEELKRAVAELLIFANSANAYNNGISQASPVINKIRSAYASIEEEAK